ncbi:complex I subunit 5 family protein [Candidatus Venteria ishoeyi]|uniref:Na(+)/H(+) antiporter subunit D n=1 Tax=Candidatus Venteria ishoeyi TaxID=1899563 RepID=A0A1H6FDI4_9GAMM|nr:proton-conducting transporter membrane subunit [Candidatus Venteria ishoeyi]SEH07713.1 Na(+)/H(+) antiporter subunit D [Candidatus Venteria ishoeyi]
MIGPVLLIALPFLGAFLLPLVYQHYLRAAYWAAPMVVITNLIIALALWFGVSMVGPQSLLMGGFAAPLGITYYIDHLALLFIILLLAGSLSLWLGAWHRRLQEEMLTLLLIGSGTGMALSGDLFNIYVFFEIMAVASYGLTASRRHCGQSFAASLRFLIVGALGSSMLLLGIALIYALTGTLNLSHLAVLAPELLHGTTGLAAFTFMLIGLGVKAELFAVNTWVPEVYAHAPIRVIALLGGFVSKLAMLIIVRLLLLLYAGSDAYLILLVFGALGLLTAEFAALHATDLRRILAYSSMGQLGLIAIAFSIPGEAGLIAGVALAAHHAVAKPALFLLIENWGGHWQKLSGAVKVAPLASIIFVIMTLSLIGVPPLPGFWAKLLLFQAGLTAGGIFNWAIVLIVLTTLIETAYWLRINRQLFQSENNQPPVNIPPDRELWPAALLLVLLLLISLNIGTISDELTQMAYHANDTETYIKHTLPMWQTGE